MQKFELSEKMLETLTGGTIQNISKTKVAIGAVAAISIAAGICEIIHLATKNEKKEHTIETRVAPPRITYPIEEF